MTEPRLQEISFMLKNARVGYKVSCDKLGKWSPYGNAFDGEATITEIKVVNNEVLITLDNGGTYFLRNLNHKVSLLCLDCKVNTIHEIYMVHDHIWKEANPDISGILCIGCIEQRLGRTLTKQDFKDSLLNFPIHQVNIEWMSDRFLDRIDYER